MLFRLDAASASTSFRKRTASATSAFISPVNAAQAAFLASFTSVSVCFSRVAISLSSAILFSSIQERILVTQSCSISHASLSFDLYLSCDPEVEWP